MVEMKLASPPTTGLPIMRSTIGASTEIRSIPPAASRGHRPHTRCKPSVSMDQGRLTTLSKSRRRRYRADNFARRISSARMWGLIEAPGAARELKRLKHRARPLALSMSFCRCDRRGGRKLVFGLPGWSYRSTHGGQDGVDVLATEHCCRVAKHVLAIVPMH